jgi:nicotinamide riboside kinase
MSRHNHIIKVAVTGPESTGKTMLCETLAKHFNSPCTNEFARTFLEARGNIYVKEELLEIAIGQLQLEQQAIDEVKLKNIRASSELHQPSFVFCDTDLNVIRIWSEIAFNACDNKILNLISRNHYDLYLLCKPDIAWIYDAQREHPEPEMREKIYHHYRDMLIFQNLPWMEINGSFENRIETAKTAVNNFIHRS